MEENVRSVVEELMRRLMLREYLEREIREAAEILSGMQTPSEGLVLGREFLASPFRQVQALGRFLLEILVTHTPEAQEILQRPEVQERGNKKPSEYSGMAEVIKMWIRQTKAAPENPPKDWLPRR